VFIGALLSQSQKKLKGRPLGLRTARYILHRSAKIGRKIKGENGADDYLSGLILV
jgi:hypothetical protein